MQDSANVIEAIVEYWNISANKRSRPDGQSVNYIRNRDLSPEDIMVLLKRYHSIIEITNQVCNFLQAIAQEFRFGQVPNERKMFLGGCCLFLGSAVHGVDLPKQLVEEIVRSFPSVIFYFPVRELIKKYLTEADALAAINEGLKRHESIDNVLSCLEAIRLYQGAMKQDSIVEPSAELFQEIKGRIGSLLSNEDQLIRETANSAARYLAKREESER